MAEVLFSLGKKDFIIEYFCGVGGGGKKKLSNSVRCMHVVSGAVGEAGENVGRVANRKAAFQRLANSQKFKAWMQLEAFQKKGSMSCIDVGELTPFKILVEANVAGAWAIEW